MYCIAVYLIACVFMKNKIKIKINKQYEKLVEQSLDLEGIDNHEYRISPRYNSDLQVL
jgi:hypothetical protein